MNPQTTTTQQRVGLGLGVVAAVMAIVVVGCTVAELKAQTTRAPSPTPTASSSPTPTASSSPTPTASFFVRKAGEVIVKGEVQPKPTVTVLPASVEGWTVLCRVDTWTEYFELTLPPSATAWEAVPGSRVAALECELRGGETARSTQGNPGVLPRVDKVVVRFKVSGARLPETPVDVTFR